MVAVLCIDNLHEFQADPGDEKTSCPECGCHYMRRKVESIEAPIMGEKVSEVTVTVEAGRHAVGGDTWIDNRAKFVESLRRNLPGISDDEAKEYARRWHGEEE